MTIMILVYSCFAQAGLNSVIINSTGMISIANVTARSGSAADIQTAVNQAVAQSPRGKVHIPAGNFNFVNIGEPWRTVNVPAGIDIIGATSQKDTNGQVIQWQTVLNMPYDVPGNWTNIPNWFMLTGNGDPNKPTRISDIKLVGYRSINQSSRTVHLGIYINNVANFRVDHCMFEHTCDGGVLTFGVKCSGVIDHCKFINLYGYDVLSSWTSGNIGYGVEIHRCFSTTPDVPSVTFEPILDVIGHYKEYSIFIEDCYFSKWRHCVSSCDGAHYVFRHNTIENDFGHYSLDAHGAQYPNSNFGTRAIEVYDNRFINCMQVEAPGHPEAGLPSDRGLLQWRGGGGVFFNNFIDNSYIYITMWSNDVGGTSGTAATWNLNDVYVWGRPAGSFTPSITEPIDPIGSNRYFVEWNRSVPDLNDPLYPNTNSSWRIAGYKPYVYPHPLTGE
jgi:hypothetical protein